MVVPGPVIRLGRACVVLGLLLLAIASPAAAGSVRLYWDPNPEPDLAGYVLVWGSAPGVYTQSTTVDGTTVSHEVLDLPDGTWYFAVRAFNAAGLHSTYSNEVVINLTTVVTPPTITRVSPASGATEGGTEVTIEGMGFEPGLTVLFGNRSADVTTQTPTSMTVFAPAAVAGTVAVTVINPDGGSATRADAFTYLTTTTPISEPAIASVSPANGPTAGGTSVTISGSDFRSGAIVRFGASLATVLDVADQVMTVRTPAGTAGAVTMTVTNPDGGAATSTSAFTYVSVAEPVSEPTIMAVTPGSGPTTGNTTVTIGGAAFMAGATVRFGALPATVLATSATTLSVRTPAAAAGLVSLTVTNPDGGSVTMGSAFMYVQPTVPVVAPTVSVVAPASGPTTGGTDVVLLGAGFQANVAVRFGGVGATIVARTSTSITARTPAAVAGAVDIRVTNPDGGTTTRAAGFTYVAPAPTAPAPTVSTFTPAKGLISGGTLVTINGTNFKAGVIVRFGAMTGTVASFATTRLVVRTPAQSEGVVSLTVLNSDGNGVLLPAAFTYHAPAPIVSSVSPNRGPASGTTDVTITGGNFRAGASVSVDALPATVVSITATRIVARMPAHAPTVVGVTVTNLDSQSASRANAYTYVAGGPAVTQVLPASGPMAGGNTITVLGSGFSNATVSIDGVSAAIISRTTEMISVRAPAHGAGPANIAVRNSDGLSVTRIGAYSYDDPNAPFVRYFAEGASGTFFDTRFALANPHEEDLPVTVTFLDTLGVPTVLEVTVPARSRYTIDASNRPPLASEAFATTFECARTIGVERTMTWAAGGPTYGAHSETGVAAPRTSWLLAEGATIGGFNTFYLLQNPTSQTAQVKVQYLLATGDRIEKVHPVAPLSRVNIWVNKDDPALAAAEMSATITSLNDVPVVVERSMYRNNGNELFSAGHNSAAAEAPALRWFLAEGATGGTFDEFVLIANPNAIPATLKVSYLRAGKAPIVRTHVAPALSRLTVWVDQEAPELANAEVSVMIESQTPTPVVVERSMWWRATPAGEWVESHNSRGATVTAPRWLVADGESGGAGEASTFVLVANTSALAAKVSFTLLTESGVTRTVEDTVTARGRYSMDAAGAFPEARGTRFSVLVESVTGTAQLVVERATYSSTLTTPWAAGTNALAMPLP